MKGLGAAQGTIGGLEVARSPPAGLGDGVLRRMTRACTQAQHVDSRSGGRQHSLLLCSRFWGRKESFLAASPPSRAVAWRFAPRISQELLWPLLSVLTLCS